jgi:uncharacterized protein (TIGR03086 family)
MNAHLSAPLRSAVETLKPVVAAVPDDVLGAPTPCGDYDVRALANHLLGTTEGMRRIGADEELDPDDPWGTAGDHMGASWREDLQQRLDGLVEAWEGPEAYEGDAMGGRMPKRMVGAMALVEVVLHGWDLARGSGQEVDYDEDVESAALEVMHQIGEMGRSQGAFGELVDVPDDATAFEQALAQAGRDARWAPR